MGKKICGKRKQTDNGWSKSFNMQTTDIGTAL